jgi:hypothetical protein
MKSSFFAQGAAALALLLAAGVQARPVGYADGHMLMIDAAPDYQQVAYTYSPSFRWSMSAGHARIEAVEDAGGNVDVTFVRSARLLRRWNLPSAQGNAFVWGGAGRARYANPASGLDNGVWHAGLQLDYETRRIYTSFVSEYFRGDQWSFRSDVASLGVAPYEHDMNRMATWIVLKAKRSSGMTMDETNAELALRFFTPTWWIDAGVDQDGRPAVNLMFNF